MPRPYDDMPVRMFAHCTNRDGRWSFELADDIWIFGAAIETHGVELFLHINRVYYADEVFQIDLSNQTYRDGYGNSHPVVGKGMITIILYGEFTDELDRLKSEPVSWHKEGF